MSAEKGNDGKMTGNVGYGHPPTANRFSSKNQPEQRRPRGKSLQKLLEELLAGQVPPETVERIQGEIGAVLPVNVDYNTAICLRLIFRALLQGDTRACSEIFDRLEGRAQQRIITQENDKPDVRDIDLSKLTDAELGEADRAMEVLENLQAKGELGGPDE